MKIYDESGYVNIKGILREGYPFNFIVGGRGTGKTYTSLKTAREEGWKFILMRRTQSQADLISKPEFSVFKPLNNDCGWDVQPERISKYNSAFVENDQQIGYTVALSTLSNMRGFDASDIQILIYDEFIPEKHERPIKNEADALWNAYETINRNRELKGIPPVQLLCLANANDITNPIFESLNLIRTADRMQKKGTERWTDDKRGIQLIMLQRSPISKKKSQTVLYNLTEGAGFSSMALENSFNVDRQHVRPRPLSEYLPVCSIGELFIYRHKAESRLYCTTHQSGIFNRKYSTSDSDRLYYRRVFCHHWEMYISNVIDFEDVLSEKLFLHYWE